MNDALRAALNPHGKPVGNGRLRIGDKLMLVGRNLHELGIMNGTLLRLLEALEGDSDDADDGGSGGGVLVATDAGAAIEIPPAEVGNLRLAYACSVHRGQGIELPIAVVVAHPAAGGRFLRREMLYTAVTRARRATVVVGHRRDGRARGGDGRRGTPPQPPGGAAGARGQVNGRAA